MENLQSRGQAQRCAMFRTFQRLEDILFALAAGLAVMLHAQVLYSWMGVFDGAKTEMDIMVVIVFSGCTSIVVFLYREIRRDGPEPGQSCRPHTHLSEIQLRDKTKIESLINKFNNEIAIAEIKLSNLVRHLKGDIYN